LASGLLSGKYTKGEPPPEGTRLAAWGERGREEMRDERMATVSALSELAATDGHGVLDLAFAWLLSHDPVASVIAGATTPEQVRANAEAGAWTPSDALLSQVDAIAPRS
jgi:aryl-alcohol dehydrogenase-like predicted oxidoreductase